MRASGCFAVLLAFCLAGCDSGKSESDHKSESKEAPAAQTVRAFYAAANAPDGKRACGLLTNRGVVSIVHVRSRAACVRTIDALEPGSFSAKDGELVDIQGVDESGDNAFDVDAALKGRSGGTYHVIKQNGPLLIDGFRSDEG